jgi:hypothetical protein
MTIASDLNRDIGIELARRLGLQLNRSDGHDLAGPCITCKSSDAFRLHKQVGVGHCFSCNGRWSPFQIAEKVLGDRERAKSLLVEMGVFEPSANGNNSNTDFDPLEAIARQKGVTSASLRVFGAQVISRQAIQLPAYGPDGKRCTTFTMNAQGGKGKFAKGKKAGLFFPHVEGKARLPQPREMWHLVEGPKDAAALHGLGLLACGLNTCRLAAKFSRLFTGVEIILIPDRDRAGEEGSEFSARVLRGVAKSVRIAVLPAEFKESDGEDVRDILRRPGGRELVLQAITDAQTPQRWDASEDDAAAEEPANATTDVKLPEGEPLKLAVSPASGTHHRLVVATRGEVEHRDRINTDSSISRDRFIKKLAAKLGIERETLAPVLEPQLTKLAADCEKKEPNGGGQPDDDVKSQATTAVNIAADWELWHTPSKEAYATFAVGDHKETWLVRSQTFKRFLCKKYFDEHGAAMNSDALSAAVNLLEAKALFEGEEHPVHVRVGEHEGNIYLDLCNATWQVIRITPQGWELIDEAPIRFRRSRGMLALPTPVSGGSVDQLRPFLNVDDNWWRLVIGWLIAAFRPRGPYPILALFAEQGSGKSTIGRFLRLLVDPNAAPLRAEPRDGRDLMIAANNSWCLTYDNLSHVPPWLSDALCRLSTGGGFTTRELYTDQDEIIFDSQRPVLLTSIEEVATRSDLLDRCLIVWLSAIEEDCRRAEADLFAAFERVRPQILGALLDAVAVALCRLPTINLLTLPRMADFALWATAAETGLGWPPGTFMAAYQSNRESANDLAIEGSVVAAPLVALLESQGKWLGSSSELLQVLEERLGDQVRRTAGWPKNPRSLSGHLKRLAPNLRAAGWVLVQDRTSKKRRWMIQRLENTEAGPPESETACQDPGDPMQGDADSRDAERDDGNDANDALFPEPWNPDRY